MHRHYWTIRPNLPREGPPYTVGFSPQPTQVVWEAHTRTHAYFWKLNCFMFYVLYQTVLSYKVVGYYGYDVDPKIERLKYE